MKKETIKKIRNAFLVTVFWIGIWELLCQIVSSELLLPSPWKVLTVWADLVQKSSFWLSTGLSLLRITIGFSLAVIVGCLLAALTAYSKICKALISPILKVVKAAPVASFIILALVWIKTDILPLFISFLMVLPLVWANVEEGILQVDNRYLELGKVYRLSNWKMWKSIRIPSLLPYLLAAMNTGLGFAWKSGIAAEIICRPSLSIGTFMQQAKINLETPEVFVWTATVIVLSVVFENLFKMIFGKLGKRYQKEQEGTT